MDHIQALVAYWRDEAKRHEEAAKDCDIGDDEHDLNCQIARVYRICATSLEKTLPPEKRS